MVMFRSLDTTDDMVSFFEDVIYFSFFKICDISLMGCQSKIGNCLFYFICQLKYKSLLHQYQVEHSFPSSCGKICTQSVLDRDPVIIPFPVKIGPFLDSRSR